MNQENRRDYGEGVDIERAVYVDPLLRVALQPADSPRAPYW